MIMVNVLKLLIFKFIIVMILKKQLNYFVEIIILNVCIHKKNIFVKKFIF